MPSFIPKSESDLNAERLLPKGEYDFEIGKAENKRFSTGSEGIALTVNIFTQDGAIRLVNDNLIFMESCMFKLSNFCKATGLYEHYKAGRLDAADCVGRNGRCKLDIEPEGEYPAKNKVTSYVVPKDQRRPAPARPSSPTPATNPPDEDDVPFACVPRTINPMRLA